MTQRRSTSGLVLLTLLGVLLMHALPLAAPAPAAPVVTCGAAAHQHHAAGSGCEVPDPPRPDHHVASPCLAVVPSAAAVPTHGLTALGAALPVLVGADPAQVRAPVQVPTWPHAPPDLLRLCISRT